MKGLVAERLMSVQQWAAAEFLRMAEIGRGLPPTIGDN